MPTPKTTAVEHELRDKIKSFESEFTKFAADVAKLAKALKDAKTSKSLWPMKSLAQIDRALKSYIQYRNAPSAESFANALHLIEGDYKRLFHTEFGKDLNEQAAAASLGFKLHDDFYTIGPFEVVPNLSRETVSAHFAKAVVLRDIPLDAKNVIQAIVSMSKELLEAKQNVRNIAADFEVAVRVCVARGGLVKHGTLRAELPQLLEEMTVIRERSKSGGTLPYGRPRFVVELVTLVKSSENIEGKLGKEFRLETAVIENSRTDSKSVFVPDRLQNGSGEGKYYQAINMIYA